MPVISTSGALSYNKVGVGTEPADWIFYLDGNVSGFGPPRIEDLDLINKTLVTSIFYSTGDISNTTPGAISISQDFSTPLIGYENNYLLTGNASTNFTFFTHAPSVGGAFIGKNISNTQILLTGGAYREVSNVTTNTGSGFSSTDLSFTFINKALVDNSPSATSRYRVGTSLLMDNTGNYYIAGWVNEPASGTGTDVCPYLTKYNGSTNAKIWTKVCRQAGAAGPTPQLDTPPVDIKFDNNGNIIMLAHGPVQDASPTNYVKMLAFNSAGTLLWQLRFSASGSGLKPSFDMDSSGNFYVVVGNLVQKYNSSRVLQWSREYKNGTMLLVLSTTVRNLKRRVFFKNDVLYILLQNQSTTDDNYIIALNPNNGDIIYSNKIDTYSWAGMTLDNDYLYINLDTNSILKAPIDGSIPGTGTYVIPNLTINYQSVSLTNTANTSFSFTAGNMTVSNANTTSITNWASNISTSTTIIPYGNITI